MLANLGLAFLSVLLELAAIASLMPMSLIAAGEGIQPGSIWAKFFAYFGVSPSFASALIYFVIVFALRLMTQFLNQATAVFVGKRVQADLSSRAFRHIVQDLSLRDIDAKSAGHFISLAGDETARAGSIVVVVNQLLATTLLATVYFAAIVYVSWWLALGVLVFLIVALLSLSGTLRKSQMLSARQLDEAKSAHSIFLDTLNGLRSIRALSAEEFVTSKYTEIIHRYTTTHFSIDTLSLTAKLIPALILLFSIAVAAAAGFLTAGNASALAVMVTSLAFLLRFFPAAGQVLSLLMRLLADVRAASDVTHLLDTPSAARQRSTLRTLDGHIETLEMRNVSFRYTPSKPIVQGISAELQRGRSYALVGPSGSGKTTLFDLLLGFYSPDSGEVLVNGISVRDLNSQQLKSRMVLIGQQVTILNDTVANNVRFGAQASDSEVALACSVAGIDSFIETLPNRYETLLSFQGSNLSGGQRQRIGIARGLLRNPDVLLLDESTTGLDAKTRDRVVGNILASYRDKIVVFSTHDGSITSRVDVVINVTRFSNAQIHEHDLHA
jgi:ABC-type bacteriocin/lantibiotic exporter with double-glycine peptidase domain